MADIKEYLQKVSNRVDKALQKCLPVETEFPQKIHEAMRYSVFAGGKRLRPFLVLESCRVCGGNEQSAMPVACAFELIHTYSLIHDDLPAMDNDDLRRGVPTSHKKFGEAIAILAGDALLTFAFNLVAREVAEAGVAQRLILELSVGAGTRGMVGGQVLDISETQMEGKEENLNYIHEMKTAALITAAARCGAIIAEASPEEFLALSQYGRFLGLAFQITDDVLDEESSPEMLGKSVGKDRKTGKLTYPAVYGVKKSEEAAASLLQRAINAISILGDEANHLRQLAKFVLTRKS